MELGGRTGKDNGRGVEFHGDLGGNAVDAGGRCPVRPRDAFWRWVRLRASSAGECSIAGPLDERADLGTDAIAPHRNAPERTNPSEAFSVILQLDQ